jgi:hypothetical protein
MYISSNNANFNKNYLKILPMKEKIFILVFLVSGFFLELPGKAQDPKVIASAKDKKYKKEWKTVDSLDRLGLPKSALEIVNKIYNLAKTDKNNDQIIKSLMYRMKYLNDSEEDIFEQLFKDMDAEISESSLPNRHLLHSMKAEMFWMYYRNNRYQILNRTNTIGYQSDDIKTWTLDQLLDKVIRHYLLSLEEKDSLFKTDLKIYDEIISFGHDARKLRPSLYDFLASRAFQFFSSTELTMNRPADFFQLKEEFYFAQPEDFINSKISTSDSLSLHYNAILILKDWLTFRMADTNTAALVDLDLSRLSFVYNKSVNANKESLYLESLIKMQDKYRQSPEYAEIGYYIAHFYYTRSEKFNFNDELTFQYKGDKVKALEICDLCNEKFPGSYGAKLCLSLKNDIQSKSLGFQIENFLAPAENFPMLITYRNIAKVYVRVGSIDPEAYQKLGNKFYGEKLYEQLLKTAKILKNYQVELRGTNDYNNHSTEAILEGLPIGTYLVFLSNNEQFDYHKNVSNYSLVTVTGLSYIERVLNDGNIEYTILDRNTGFPLKDVQVKAIYQDYDYKSRTYKKFIYGTYTTDADGRCVVEFEKTKQSKSISIELTYGKDFYDPDGSTYLYSRNYQRSSYRKVFLYTDRAIYRPGQTVYYKGIMLSSDGEKSEAEVNKQTTVVLYDVNFQKVAEQVVTTNEFGSFSGNFVIPKGLLNGQMQLYTYDGSMYFSVEEYKRPKFQVEMLPFTGSYVLNDTVKVIGKAVSFAGSMISEAKVKYRVLRKPVWRGWWYYSYPDAEYQMAEGSLISNEKGEFEIKFMALPDLTRPKNKYLFFQYEIIIDVTDLNGETQSTRKTMLVGSSALEVSLDIPEQIAREKAGTTNINTRNVNGEFLPAKGEIRIFKLKNPEAPLRDRPWNNPDEFIYSLNDWNKLFPGNVYKDENNHRSREKEKLILSRNFDTEKEKSLDLSAMQNWDPGIYVAETKSVDAFGNPVEWSNYFVLYALKDGQMPDSLINWFVPVNTTVEVGEKAKFIIGSGLRDTRILYEIEHQANIVERKWLEPRGKQLLIEIPVREEYRGNFSVHFVFMKNNRIYKHGVTINVPRTDRLLDITFETFRDKLVPGQDEEWKIKIRGKNGEKVAAELMASLYDASLDQFRPNSWYFSIYNSYYATLNWRTNAFGTIKSRTVSKDLNPYVSMPYKAYDYLNWFGFNYYAYDRYYDYEVVEEAVMLDDVATGEGVKKKNGGKKRTEMPLAYEKIQTKDEDKQARDEESGLVGGLEISKPTETDFSNVQIRTNFNETAFFYPHLQTNEEGEVIVRFKIPGVAYYMENDGICPYQRCKIRERWE